MIENSQARAAYKVSITMNLPESLDSTNQARSSVKKPLVIESVISLGADSRRVDIETTLVNTVKDHRLRAVFPSYLDVDTSSGEAQFDVVDHPVFIKQPPLELWKEDQPKQFAQKSFSSVSDGERGLTIANNGLPEYEVTPDNERAIAITLLRSVAYLSTGYKNTRQSPAGPIIATPESQMLGRKMVFKYSIIPHAGKWNESHAQREAHAFVQGMKAMPVLYTSKSADLPTELSFINVESGNAMLSSIKCCEDGKGYSIRLWNGSESAVKANVSLFKSPAKICKSNIREDCLEEIKPGKELTLDVPAKKIETIKLA